MKWIIRAWQECPHCSGKGCEACGGEGKFEV
jgi:hypothetical protein